MTKDSVEVIKNIDGTIQQGIIRKNGRKILAFTHVYDDIGLLREVDFQGKITTEALDLYTLINKERRIHTMAEKSIDTWHDRGTYKEWLADGSYTERWEQGFRPWLYHGRTGSYWRSESFSNPDFKDWTNPLIGQDPFTATPFKEQPWTRHILMRNEHPNTLGVLDQLYVGFPKAHHRQVFTFEARLSQGEQTPDNHYIGFEVNSGGSFGNLATLGCFGGLYYLYAMNFRHVGAPLETLLTLNYPNAWARYALIYDPPLLEFWQSKVANVDQLELAGRLDLVDVRGKAIPFMANEDTTAFSEFKVGNIWIYELESPGTLKNEYRNTIEPIKTPTIWRLQNIVNAGDTVVWTPAAGKRFRWMGGSISVPGRTTLAAAGFETIAFHDGAGAINISYDIALPAAVAAIPLNWSETFNFPGNGYISTAINNPLIVNLSAACTAGYIHVNVWGTEELF
jgi:hypothetical protein